jgi:ribosomal protein S18 acetylase RimI-like enzyme
MVYNGDILRKTELLEIVRIHSLSLQSSMISYLGNNICKLYYKFIINSKKDILFVINDDVEILGSCVLSRFPNSLMSRFILRNCIPVSTTVLVKLFSQKKRKNIFNFLLNRSHLPDEVQGLSEIVQIFTNPEFRNLKIGTRLLKLVEEYLVKENVHSYYLKTLSNESNDAIFFYERRDFIKVGIDSIGSNSYAYFKKNI